MRIIDQPNHPHYGPVRRMWVILQQLGLDDTDAIHLQRFHAVVPNWEMAVEWLFVREKDWTESEVQVYVLCAVLRANGHIE